MTLIELIIVLAVIGIMAGVLYQVFITGSLIYTKSKYEEDLIQNARVAMDWIVRDVRSANTIEIEPDNFEKMTIMYTSTYSIVYQPISTQENSLVLGRKIIKNRNNTSFSPITAPDTYLRQCLFTPIYSTESPSVAIGVNVKIELVPYNVGAKKIVKGPINTVRSFILEGKVYVRKLILNSN